MLASTMQFSSNEQTPTPQPTTHPEPQQPEQSDGRPARTRQQPPRPQQTRHLFPQDPTACHDPPTQPDPTVPTTTCHHAIAVLGRPATGPASLMSTIHP
jgi:hypothetical protein